MKFHLAFPLAAFFATAACLTGCDKASPPPYSDARPDEAAPVEARAAARPSDARSFKERQVAFLNRIRTADPQSATFERVLLNEQNELGLILDRSVEMDKIPALMRTMLTQMAREFPDQDLTVLAYTPSEPPRKIGTARLDARTRDMTYTPER